MSSWDFSTIWQTNSGDYPTLQGFSSVSSPTPTPTSGSTSSGSSSVASNGSALPSCTEAPPANAPQLFQVSARGLSANLYFVPVQGQNTKYVISYGLDANADNFATMFDDGESTGAVLYTVNSLFPATWYFKVRGQNGCMPGTWSRTLSVKVTLFGATTKTSQ